MVNNSQSIEQLFKKSEWYLKKVNFYSEKLKVSELKTHTQPEKFPFFNSKFFEVNITTRNVEEKQESIKFYVFSFDDDFIMNLHGFF